MFFGCVLQGQLEIEFKSSMSASLLLAATTVCLALAKLLSGPLCADFGTLLQGFFVPPGLLKGLLPEVFFFVCSFFFFTWLRLRGL